MPPGKTDQLVIELRTWQRNSKTRQKDLAGALDLSPQQLGEIFGGRNRPTAEQAFRILEFLKDKNMTTTIPKTLTDARDQLETAHEEINSLNAQLAQLRSAPATATLTTPTKREAIITPKPVLSQDAPAIDPERDPGFHKVEQTKAPPAKLLPVAANTPVLIQKILDVTNFEDCLALLANPKHTRLQQSMIYAEIKSRRDLERNRYQ